MRTVCLTLGGERQELAARHFEEVGIGPVQWFRGIDAKAVGLETSLPYEVDAPGSGFNMGPKGVGIWLGHRMLWAALRLLESPEPILILEDDAKFLPPFGNRLVAALHDVPDDWDVLFVGSGCTFGHPTRHVAGEVYEVRYPQCLHAYIVRPHALMTMVSRLDEARCYAPVDIALVMHVWPHCRVYTVLPRLVEQFNTDIPT